MVEPSSNPRRGHWIQIAGPLLALALGIAGAAFYNHPVGVLRWFQLTRLGWAGIAQNEIALNDGLMTYLLTGGYPEAEPVVLIHGLGPVGALEWREVMPALSEAHFKTIAPNLFGFASSEHKQVKYTIAYQAAAIDQLIDALKLDHVNLVGHDLGADVALYETALHPEKIERLVLVSGGLVGRHGAKNLRENLLPSNAAAMHAQAGMNFFDLPAMPEFMYERMVVDLAQDLYAQSDMLDSLPGDEAFIRSRLGQIFNTLTVIVWGGEDQIVPSSSAQAIHDALPGSATAIFKETGHAPQLEHPDEFNESMLFFLKQKEGGR